jgi:hypothetical protein
VSFLTTAYGGWVFDVVVLLLPVLQAAVWMARSRQTATVVLAAAFYVAIDGTAMTMNLLDPDGQTITLPWYMWVTPAILVCYLFLRRRMKMESPSATGWEPSLELSSKEIGSSF